MLRAVRPLFALAALLLLASLVALGIRSSGDTITPTALDTAGGTPTDGATGGIDPTTGEPATPGATEASEPEPPDGAPSDTEEPVATSSPDVGGTAGTGPGEATGGEGGTDGDGATSGSGGEADPSERPVDDMPNTGGGLATALGGLVAFGAAAGLTRRD